MKGYLRSIIEIKVVESIGALILEFEGQEFNSETKIITIQNSAPDKLQFSITDFHSIEGYCGPIKNFGDLIRFILILWFLRYVLLVVLKQN